MRGAGRGPYLAQRLSRIAGVAGNSKIDILDRRWTGLDLTDEEPWWATAVRGWLAMTQAIQQGGNLPPKLADPWRKTLDSRMDREGPGVVYAVYKDWASACEREARK